MLVWSTRDGTNDQNPFMTDGKSLGDHLHAERLLAAMCEAEEFLLGLKKREAFVQADDFPALIAKSRIVIQHLVDCASDPASLRHLGPEAAAATRAHLIQLGRAMQAGITASLSAAWSELERNAAAPAVTPSRGN
jgi:hypothetical protein